MSARRPQKQRLFLRGVRFQFDNQSPSIIPLPPEDAHHLLTVLRLPYDSYLDIVESDTGAVAEGCLINDAGNPSIKLIRPIDKSTCANTRYVLVVALCKGQKNEQIVDWATELGCSQIVFWQSSRSVVRLKNQEEAERKQKRFQKIAQSAAQQSKQSHLTRVSVHLSLAEALAILEDSATTHRLVCSLEPEARPLDQVSYAEPLHQTTIIAVGPEGDFAPEEYQILTKEEDFVSVSLGESTLRSELAAITALIAIRLQNSDL